MKKREPKQVGESERSRFTAAVEHMLKLKPSDIKDEPKAKHPKRKRRGKPGHT